MSIFEIKNLLKPTKQPFSVQDFKRGSVLMKNVDDFQFDVQKFTKFEAKNIMKKAKEKGSLEASKLQDILTKQYGSVSNLRKAISID